MQRAGEDPAKTVQRPCKDFAKTILKHPRSPPQSTMFINFRVHILKLFLYMTTVLNNCCINFEDVQIPYLQRLCKALAKTLQ